MQTLILGHSSPPVQKKVQVAHEKVIQDLKTELAKTRGKLGFLTKENNQLRREIDGRPKRTT